MDHPNIVSCRVRVINLHILYFSPPSFYFNFGPKILLSTLILFLLVRDQFYTIHNKRQDYSSL